MSEPLEIVNNLRFAILSHWAGDYWIWEIHYFVWSISRSLQVITPLYQESLRNLDQCSEIILPCRDQHSRSHCPQRCCQRRHYWPHIPLHWRTSPRTPSQQHSTALEYCQTLFQWNKLSTFCRPWNWNPGATGVCTVHCHIQVITPAIILNLACLFCG